MVVNQYVWYRTPEGKIEENITLEIGPAPEGARVVEARGGRYWCAGARWGGNPQAAGRSVRVNREPLPAEAVLLSVLRGAHRRPVAELREALGALGLPHGAMDGLKTKGLVEVRGGVVSFLTASRKPATRAAVVWVPKPGMWDGPYPSASNPLYNGVPWYEIVGWPAYRGGRPPSDGRRL